MKTCYTQALLQSFVNQLVCRNCSVNVLLWITVHLKSITSPNLCIQVGMHQKSLSLIFQNNWHQKQLQTFRSFKIMLIYKFIWFWGLSEVLIINTSTKKSVLLIIQKKTIKLKVRFRLSLQTNIQSSIYSDVTDKAKTYRNVTYHQLFSNRCTIRLVSR